MRRAITLIVTAVLMCASSAAGQKPFVATHTVLEVENLVKDRTDYVLCFKHRISGDTAYIENPVVAPPRAICAQGSIRPLPRGLACNGSAVAALFFDFLKSPERIRLYWCATTYVYMTKPFTKPQYPNVKSPDLRVTMSAPHSRYGGTATNAGIVARRLEDAHAKFNGSAGLIDNCHNKFAGRQTS